MRDRVAPIVAAVLLASLPAASWATPTKSFRQTTAKDFEEGEAEASMILPTGEVVPGMKTSPVHLEAAFVWCSALSRDGRTAYFGTGDEGKIFAVNVDGKGAPKGEDARKVATLDSAWVTALLVRPDGTLLAGTTPGGRIFTVDPKNGAAKQVAKLAADHIWALTQDDKTGTTYVGTGSPGKIFAIDIDKAGKGKSRQVWDSGDQHIVSLAQADDHHLLAGTSEEAILYRVSTDGHAEAVQDFEAEEVRAIARAGDAVYVAVNDFEKATPPALVGPPAAKGTKVVIAASGTPASAGALPRPGQRKSKAALYRLDRDGRIEQVFSVADGYFTALLVEDQGGGTGTAGVNVYVASGTQGRVYRVKPDRTASLAIDLPERQALTLVKANGAFLVGTGDGGAIYRARPAVTAGEATYLSRVLDAESRAHWGLFRWHGAKGLSIETRSGSTAKPDTTWSSFQKLQGPHATAQGGTGQVQSPPARYVQYRAMLEGADARLGEVTLAYLPQNQRARVIEFTASDGTAAGSVPPVPGTTVARAHSPIVKLRWKVENLDGDELSYRLSFREENEAVWRPLGGPDPLLKPELDWNTDGLPDATYLVRIVTSDERVQPRERALDATFLSPPVLVDNRKPEVAGLSAKYPFVSGRARDQGSPITQIEVAVDGSEWREVAPTDGICDDLVESFTVKLPPLLPGPHAVTVRAWDGADNVGAASVTVRGP
jgi:outer membrane protein assembly factor BamB